MFGGIVIERDSVHLVPFTGYLTFCLYTSIVLVTAALFALMIKVPVSEIFKEFTLFLYPLKSQFSKIFTVSPGAYYIRSVVALRSIAPSEQQQQQQIEGDEEIY